MEIALLDIRQNAQNPLTSSMVAYRNLVQIQKYFNCDFIYNKNKVPTKKYDIIICGFGSNFSEYNQSVRFINNNPKARVYWLIGEYEQGMFPAIHYSCIKKGRKVSLIKNHEKPMKKEWVDKEHIVNLNALIYEKPNEPIEKKYDCVYYSRWRPGRAKYLKTYLKKPIYFSSDTKNFKKHKEIGCDPTYIKKLKWDRGREELNLFRYSLYIEDEFTHKCYNHLANRFYESLKCNVVQFFDRSCENTIIRSGIDFDDYYYINNHSELIDKLHDYSRHIEFQNRWNQHAVEEKKEVIEKLRHIFES